MCRISTSTATPACRNAVVVVNENRFGRGPITSARVTKVDAGNFRPNHTAPRIDATPANFKPNASRGIRSPKKSLKQPVVATRPSHTQPGKALAKESNMGQANVSRTPNLVGAPKQQKVAPAMPRPSSGSSTVKQPAGDRTQRSASPRLESPRQAERVSKAGPPVTRQLTPQSQRKPQVGKPSTAVPQLQARRKPQVSGPSTAVPQLQARLKPQVTGLSTAAPQSQTRRKTQVTGPSTTVPQSQARRPDSLYPQDRRVPGELANQLSPNRVKGREKPSTSPRATLKNAPQERVWPGRP